MGMRTKNSQQLGVNSDWASTEKSLLAWLTLILLILMLALAIVFGQSGEAGSIPDKVLSSSRLTEERSAEREIVKEGELIDGESFLEEELLQASFKRASLIGDQEGRKEDFLQIQGGVVPHHLPAGFIVADFFRRLSKNQKLPETVIILGPNHQEKGDFPVLTTGAGWQTARGVVRADQEIINQLLEANLARERQAILEEEHSIGVL